MLKSCKIRKCLWHMHKMDKKFYQMFKRRMGRGGGGQRLFEQYQKLQNWYIGASLKGTIVVVKPGRSLVFSSPPSLPGKSNLL